MVDDPPEALFLCVTVTGELTDADTLADASAAAGADAGIPGWVSQVRSTSAPFASTRSGTCDPAHAAGWPRYAASRIASPTAAHWITVEDALLPGMMFPFRCRYRFRQQRADGRQILRESPGY